MRTLLALILSWLMPAQGKRRATPPTQHVPTDEPTQRLIITHNAVTVTRGGAGVGHPRDYLRGEDVALIRPYLIAYERTHGIYHQEEAAWLPLPRTSVSCPGRDRRASLHTS